MKPQQAPRFHGTSTGKTASSAGAAPPRSNKTLGWFLNDEVFEKKMSSGANSPTMKTAPMVIEAKMGSVVPQMPQQKIVNEEKRRRRGARRGKKQDYGQTPSEGSTPSEDFGDDKQKIINDFKDDYWYYDLVSDGYYYEQNGAKGWRKRMPSGWQGNKKPELEPSGKDTLKMSAAANQMLQSALYQQPAYKYYDAASDGYFYEMASVDGWRKRQPTSATSGKPVVPPRMTSTQPTQSYGAALARGQMPRNCIVSDSSASSSASDDAAIQDLVLSALDDFSFEPCTRANALGGNEFFGFANCEKIYPSEKIYPHYADEQKPIEVSRTPLITPGKPEVPRMDSGSSLWSGWQGLSSDTPSEEENMGQLIHDLQKIWQTPTPTV